MDHPEFDTRVQHRDGKSGKIVKETPYIYKVSRDFGEVYERGGVEYHPNGSIKRDMREKVEAAQVETPQPLKVEAPDGEHDAESAREAALGIPSEQSFMQKAVKKVWTQKGKQE